ncbi:MAG: hypothetical protein MRJ93_00030 [Nitrososphaeraceae archaeon]|nr:hypothetical protein [Nitrososphaeraceae archaeon]
MNTKTKICSMFLLATIMAVGTILITTIPKSFAEPGVNIQEIKCVNFNANINGIDINKIPREMTGDAATAQGLQGDEHGIRDGTGNGMFGNDGLNIDKNLLNICLNLNFNDQEKVPILGDLTRTVE